MRTPIRRYPATGLVLNVAEHASVLGHGTDEAADETAWTLEERAARHDADAAATAPDPSPIVSVACVRGVGALPRDVVGESSTYAPVERAEQLTTANLAVAYAESGPRLVFPETTTTTTRGQYPGTRRRESKPRGRPCSKNAGTRA